MHSFLRRFTKFFTCFGIVFFLLLTTKAQTVLVDCSFTSTTLPPEITSNGAISPTKAADGVCTIGAIQVNNGGGFLQVDLSSCTLLTMNMKSTGPSARLVTVKYKKQGDVAFTTVTTTLSVQLAASFNFTALFPAIVSTIPVTVRVEPGNGNIQIHDLYATSNASFSNAAEIIGFSIAGQTGTEVINSAAGTIAVNVPLGTTLTGIIPQTFTLSPQATVNPLKTAAQDFSSPVNYVVTAENGTTTKNWTVTVTPVASTGKDITAFKLSNTQIGNATINSAAGTIAVNMPIGSNLTAVVPQTLTLSANAAVSPGAATAQDFSVPVLYTVTAQDNSTKQFTVTVSLVNPNAIFSDYQAEEANFTGTVDNNHLNYTGTGFINFLATGDNSIIFSVCETAAGNQTAKFRYSLANATVRKGKLFLNDTYVQLLDFAPTPTFDDWYEETVSLNLLSGVNFIKITWDTTDGPNLDKLMLTGTPCTSYTLNLTATNGGVITKTPLRTSNKYFAGETVTLQAQPTPTLSFNNWSGDLTGNANPAVVTMNANKTIVGNFSPVTTYKLNVAVSGLGSVTLSPAGGEYAVGTVVTMTANTLLGSSFSGYTGDVTGAAAVQTVTMNSIKNVTATFSSGYVFNFDNVVGFASMAADGFAGPTRGGQCAADTFWVTGPAQFNNLCEALYYRQQAYKNNVTTNGMKKAPLVIMLKAGIYDGLQALSANGAKIFGNYMMDIPEQGDLTFMGESGVVFKIGINVKRAYNILIRNISFQDYYDDGINIGYPETHHIWIDHCTIGSITGFPADSEHPDGGCDVKDGASYVTISWCLFRNSYKTSLNGHSDNNGATDNGRLKITYVNNYFRHTNSRNPRVRFGQVHVLNNLLDDVLLYGSVAANSAQIVAENNFYLNTDWPMYADRSVADFKAVYGNNTDDTYTSKTGNYPASGLKQFGNEYDDSGLPVITAQINPAMLNPGGRSIKFDELNAGSVFNPSSYYSYTPFTAQETKAIVPLKAGADKVTFSTAGCSVLPVQLLSFDAKLSGAGFSPVVNVTWKTTEEINLSRFEIEKSSNAKDFVKAGTVNAINTGGTHTYGFADQNPYSNVSYYRLKQIDFDGRYTFSKIVAVNNKNKSVIAVQPNPVTNNFVLTYPALTAKGNIKIFAADGRLVKTVEALPGTTITAVDAATLSPGLYMIEISNGRERTSTKFIKK